MELEVSFAFWQDLIMLTEESVKHNAYGFSIRSPEVDGEYVEYTITFKPITKEDK